jgi:hypothetical protein
LTPAASVRHLFSWVKTLGEAWKLGWRVRARCVVATTAGHTHQKRYTLVCETSADLDMKSLVWTRGEAFPLDQLASRLRCPRCGSRSVQVVFEVPNRPKSRAVGR